jgi:hypothetical protein
MLIPPAAYAGKTTHKVTPIVRNGTTQKTDDASDGDKSPN